MPHTHPPLHVALSRKITGETLGPSRTKALSEMGSIGTKNYFRFFVFVFFFFFFSKAVPSLKRLVAGISVPTPTFDPWPFHARFVVKVALG
jgi:hypothetical protein